MVASSGCTANEAAYSVTADAYTALEALVTTCYDELPQAALQNVREVRFTSPSPRSDSPVFPCPLKENETVSAIKGLEACVASVIADLRFGQRSRATSVDVRKVTCFLMSAYITTVDGLTKADSRVREKLIGWSTVPKPSPVPEGSKMLMII